MSAKSWLQLILLILIFLIIGGIYFLYFYSGPLKDQNLLTNTINKINEKDLSEENILEEEILEDIIVDKNNFNKNQRILNLNTDDLNQNKNLKNSSIETREKNNKEIINKENKNIKNLTKEIEYITSNKDGDIFKVLAKYGKTNIKNSNILDLEQVDGIISSTTRSQIYITSDYAKYNYGNQNSQFYSNVEIKYDNKTLYCDNLDLKINENYAVAYNNVTIKDNKSIMKAQVVILDLITKDIKINSQDKIKIITN